MTKVTIFSGFLGAGKTTLIKKLLADGFCGEKLVLIENEFGEIGIDGGFLQEAGIAVTEMNSGCICCSLVGDFGKALQQVLTEYAPDRIIIEPSGVGKLSDVIAAVKGVDAPLVLDGFATVADAKRIALYSRNFGEFFNDQIGAASCVVLSRTEGLSEDKLQEAVTLLRTQNASAPIITTPWDQLSGAKILATSATSAAALAAQLAEETAAEAHTHANSNTCGCGHHEHGHEHGETCGCGGHHEHGHEHGETCGCGGHHEHGHEHGEACGCGGHHEHGHEHGETCGCGGHHEHGHEHHHAAEVFTSFGMETPRHYTAAELDFCLQALEEGSFGTVLRAKGIVAGPDNTWLHFDYVPGEANVRQGSADYTGRLCVIGTDLQEDALRTLFHG